MDRQKVIEIARSAMARRRTAETREAGYIFHHGLRTAHIAMGLADRVDGALDMHRDILFAGAVFHDIGKGTEPHNETGADMAAERLSGHCDDSEIAAIAGIIRQHNQRRRAAECTPAARVVQDADILDHCGAQEIWLAFHWNAAHDQTPRESLAYANGTRKQRWNTGARAALNFEASRRALDERLAFQRAFWKKFAEEMDGAL